MMKLFELSTGNFKLIKENGELHTFHSEKEIVQELGGDLAFELLLQSEYKDIKGSTPTYFYTPIRKYVVYENGREVEINSRDDLLKYKSNLNVIKNVDKEDMNLLHYITFEDGSTEVMTLKESLDLPSVKEREVLFN